MPPAAAAKARRPLEAKHSFCDHAGSVLRTPVPGRPDMVWTVGVSADGEPVDYDWDAADKQHILISGATGTGRHGAAMSCLVQMLHNNTPEDLQVWIADQDNTFRPFAGAAHIARWAVRSDLGPGIGGEDQRRLYADTAALISDAAAETRRRLQGRGGLVRTPRLLLVIGESDRFFCSPHLAEAAGTDLEALGDDFERIALDGPQAGIHLLLATMFWPDTRAFNGVRHLSTHIGMHTGDTIGSLKAVGAIGLERIPRSQPGRGIISWEWQGIRYTEFRGLNLGGRPDRDSLIRRIVAELPSAASAAG